MTGIVWRRVDPAREPEAEQVMRELMILSRQHEGFLGSEIFPPIPGVQDAYVVLYRFDSGENLRRWLQSPDRRNLLGRLETHLLQPQLEFFFAHRRQTPGTASTVFSYRIKPGCEPAFRDWRRRILEESRTWPGFLGTESFDTVDSGEPEFLVVVRFDTQAHLDTWLQSKERTAFLDEVQQYVEHWRIRRQGTGFEGWFDYSDTSRLPAPWRQGMVILAALFPVIMILRQLLAPVFAYLPFPAAFLVLLTVDVALLTYVIMPHFSRLMNFWLRPRRWTWRGELGGWAILLGLIVVTLVICLDS